MSIHVAGTDPYPWPYDGCLAASRIALVRCGWQDHWASISHDTDVVAARLAVVADAVLAVGGLVVDLRHGCASGQSRRLPAVGSSGWNRYRVDAGALLIDAAGTDGCFGSALESQLWALGCGRVVLGGFAAEITVDSTLRSLNDRGFE